MFKEQDLARETVANSQRGISEAAQLKRFQVDLQGSLASRLLGASSPADERADIQTIVNAWTENWTRMGSQTAAQAMTTQV